MLLLDHLFIIVLVVVQPIAGYINFNRLVRRAAAGNPIDRGKLYLETIAGQWILFGLALGLWFSQQRSWHDLGFSLTMDKWFVVAVALAIGGIVLLVMQLRQAAATDTETLRGSLGELGKLEFIFPRNGNELGRFYGLALTAGVVEETLWRGFIIWYFSLFLPLWAAALISAVGFGVAHAYQGIQNVPKITIVGAAFTALYLLSGSLWLPMVFHAAVDILQGRLIYDVIRRCDNDSPRADNNSDAAVASGSSHR